jgi:fumarate reductase subunit D
MASLFHPRLFLLVALLAPLGSMAVHAHPDHHQPSHQSDHLGNPDQQQHQDHGH